MERIHLQQCCVSDQAIENGLILLHPSREIEVHLEGKR